MYCIVKQQYLVVSRALWIKGPNGGYYMGKIEDKTEEKIEEQTEEQK